MYSLAVQELLITITTQSAANEPGLGWVGLGCGVQGLSARGGERKNGAPTGVNNTIPSASIGRNVGHPPAFSLCLTLNLVAGMGKGEGSSSGRREGGEEEVGKGE